MTTSPFDGCKPSHYGTGEIAVTTSSGEARNHRITRLSLAVRQGSFHDTDPYWHHPLVGPSLCRNRGRRASRDPPQAWDPPSNRGRDPSEPLPEPVPGPAPSPPLEPPNIPEPTPDPVPPITPPGERISGRAAAATCSRQDRAPRRRLRSARLHARLEPRLR